MPAPYPQWYDATDSTVQSSVISVSGNAGTTIGPTTYHLWNDKGGAQSAGTLSNARLSVQAYNGSNWVSSGLPILDEAWIQVQISGTDKTGDSTMEDQSTGYVPLGAGSVLILKSIPKNCARYASFKIVIPASSANLSQDVRLVVIYDETVVVLPLRLGTISGSGVIPDWVDPSTRRLRSGRGLTAAGTDVVTIAKGEWNYDGVPYFRIQETLTLNQTAADGALSAGQSYIAVISQPANSAPVATKGNKGASPSTPATPAGNIYLGKVTVVYQAGGTSIINSGNLDVTGVLYGEYFVTAGTGLNAKIGAGSAMMAPDQQPFNTATATIALSPNTSDFVILLPDGTFSMLATLGITLAEAQRLGYTMLAKVDTDGSGVTGVSNERSWVSRALDLYVMRLRYPGPSETALATADWDLLPLLGFGDLEQFNLEGYYVRVAAAVGSSNVKLDIKYDDGGGAWTTIFTSNGTSDLRPVVAVGVTPTKSVFGSDHEVRQFTPGFRFSFDFISGTAGGATDTNVYLFFRRK